MKTNFLHAPGWALSSHGHPCVLPEPVAPATPLARRSAPAPAHARRPNRRPAQLAAYWMQAGELFR